MAGLALPDGIGPASMFSPTELKQKYEDDVMRQCRMAASNVVCSLVEHGALDFADKDPDATVAWVQTLVGKYARFLKNGEAITS